MKYDTSSPDYDHKDVLTMSDISQSYWLKNIYCEIIISGKK